MIPARLVGTGAVRVIAAHDWLVPSGAWGCFRDYLDGEQFTYALLDARGYGARRSVAGEYSMREWARDIIALADQLGWDEFCLLGHSMGAKAAQQAMADAPHRVRRLAALAPTPPGPVQLDASQRTLFENAVHSPRARRELVDYSTGRRAGAGWLNYMVRASCRGSTPAAFAAYADSFVHDDLTADVAGIPTPVKVIAGKHDQATSEHQIRSIWPDIYPNFQLQVLADAGHYPMHETRSPSPPPWNPFSHERHLLDACSPIAGGRPDLELWLTGLLGPSSFATSLCETTEAEMVDGLHRSVNG